MQWSLHDIEKGQEISNGFKQEPNKWFLSERLFQKSIVSRFNVEKEFGKKTSEQNVVIFEVRENEIVN